MNRQLDMIIEPLPKAQGGHMGAGHHNSASNSRSQVSETVQIVATVYNQVFGAL